MEIVKITLYVHTQTIDAKNVDASCTFMQPREVSNENYTVIVNTKETVIWDGVSLDSVFDKVDITLIQYSGDFNIFGKQTMKGNDDGIITAIVDNDTNGEKEIYTIYFDVYNKGILRGSYSIDPKLQVNP